MECFFPIDRIEKGTSVAIWGAGELGKNLIEWNRRFQYCNITCVFDCNQEIEIPDDIVISRIEEWEKFCFEKMVITMTRNLSEIRKKLFAEGIPVNRCIFLAEGNYINYGMAPKVSYSQEGEDIIICSLLKRLGKEEVSFCDIGSNDPYYLNNTYLLERTFKIKQGVLIEPNPILAYKISKERRKSLCINCGITDSVQRENLKFYIMNPDTLSSFSKEEIRGYEKEGYTVEKEEYIRCVNVNDILDEYFSEGVDVISTDTEGFDLKIIKSINYKKHRPVVFCVETCGFNMGKDKDGLDIIKFLTGQGYIVYADTFLNTIFVDREAMETQFSRDMKTIYPLA